MAENTTAMNEEAVKNLVVNTSKVIKSYIDQQDGKTKVEAQEALSAVEARLQSQLDLISKVDDADGITTLAERLKLAEEALKNGDALVEVQNRFVSVESAISDITSRIAAVEDGIAGLNVKIDNNKQAVTDLAGKVAADIETAKTDVEAKAKAYADSLAMGELNLDGALAEVEDLFGIKLDSDNSNAL
jgi:predicted  nucleic acid-binding Zn-ribbon protein